MSLGGAGTATEGLVFGGTQDPPNLANTEEYNGTSWTEVADLSTARGYTGGHGTQPLALASGGTNPTTAATEEFTSPVEATVEFDLS